MISKELTTFQVDGKDYKFDCKTFDNVFHRRAKEKGMKIAEFEQTLADQIHVSQAAVHNWRMGLNGPSDLDKVKGIAEVLNLDTMNLLIEKRGEMMNREQILTDRQLEALRRVFVSIEEFFMTYDETEGFSAYYDYDGKKPVKPCIDAAETAYRKVEKTLRLEYFDLGNTEVYHQLIDFWDEDLFSLIQPEKLTPRYRYEPIDDEGNMNNDQGVVEKKAYEIFDPYIGSSHE
jgi:hypothetical protein